MNNKLVGVLVIILLMIPKVQLKSQTLKESAQAKIISLQTKITQAEKLNIDVTREEATLWFAKSFLTFADWDEDNVAINENIFNQFWPYRKEKSALAQGLADFERQEVIKMLDTASEELDAVINGKIVRRPVPVIDWENVSVEGDKLVNNGKPVFLYDYFSKTPDVEVGNAELFNDYLGNIYHPWSTSPSYCNEDYTMQQWQYNQHINSVDKNIGYSMLWHFPTPQWVKNLDPEVEKGTSIFIGYDIDNPTMKKVWDKVLYQVGTNVIDKKFNKLSFCLSNEPHWFSEQGHWTASAGEMQTISTYTIAKFKAWLSNKYKGDISVLNTLWNKTYSSFQDVELSIPIASSKRGTPAYYDWCRFNMDRGTEWLTSLHSALKKGYPDARTHVKVMPDLFTEEARHHGVDLEAITELTEFIGNDAKTRKINNTGIGSKEWEENYSYFWEELAVSYDFMESVAPNKPHINSEVHFLSTSHYRDLEMKPSFVRSCYWLATLHGMDVGLTWLWSRRPDGRIEDAIINGSGGRDGGYPGSVNQQPRVANELTRTMMDLNAFSEEIYTLRTLRKPIRIFFTETSAINKKTHMHDLFELYESLYFNGLPIGYATEKIIKNQDNSQWDVVIVYKTQYVTDDEFSALQTYLNNGGTVVIDDGRSLTMNEYGQKRNISLSQGAGQLIKMGSSVSYNEMKNKALAISREKGQYPKVEINETNNLSKRGCVWRVTPLEGGKYLMTIVNLGKNKATLQPKIQGEQSMTISTDLLTGKKLGASFDLEPEGVLLLSIEVVNNASSVNKYSGESKAIVYGGDGVITIKNALNSDVRIVNVLGQVHHTKKNLGQHEVLSSPKGVQLVLIDNYQPIKVFVK